jgi:hypothetical protein
MWLQSQHIWNLPVILFPEHRSKLSSSWTNILFSESLDLQTQKPSDSECYAPSPEPFRTLSFSVLHQSMDYRTVIYSALTILWLYVFYTTTNGPFKYSLSQCCGHMSIWNVGRKRKMVRVIRKNQQQTISHIHVFDNMHYLKPFVYTVLGTFLLAFASTAHNHISLTLVITYKVCHIYCK